MAGRLNDPANDRTAIDIDQQIETNRALLMSFVRSDRILRRLTGVRHQLWLYQHWNVPDRGRRRSRVRFTKDGIDGFGIGRVGGRGNQQSEDREETDHERTSCSGVR